MLPLGRYNGATMSGMNKQKTELLSLSMQLNGSYPLSNYLNLMSIDSLAFICIVWHEIKASLQKLTCLSSKHIKHSFKFDADL